MRAFNQLAVYYSDGEHLERNLPNAMFCLEVSARAGYYNAHFELGRTECKRGHNTRAVKHFHVAAATGYKPALDIIQKMCGNGEATRDEFLAAIQPIRQPLLISRARRGLNGRRNLIPKRLEGCYRYVMEGDED